MSDLRKPKPMKRVHIVTIRFPDAAGFYNQRHIVESFKSRARAVRLCDRLRGIPGFRADVESMPLEAGR